MISQDLQSKINEAMKAGDSIRVSTLKMLSSELHNAKIAKGAELSEDEEIQVAKKEAKKRKDAIEALYQAQGAQTTSDNASLQTKLDNEQAELAILEEYLPKQMSAMEISMLVDKAIAQTDSGNIQDIGRVIGKVMELSKGRADGKIVSDIAKEKLI